MSLPRTTNQILTHLGYQPEHDFRFDWLSAAEGGKLEWLHPDPQPTEAEILAAELPAANAATWAAQAAARKDREAKAALALPDSDDPVILRRKLNAALHLIQR
jgi:hypothetical protein